MYCKNCGTKISDADAKFCIECGCAISKNQKLVNYPVYQEVKPKKNYTLLIWFIFCVLFLAVATIFVIFILRKNVSIESEQAGTQLANSETVLQTDSETILLEKPSPAEETTELIQTTAPEGIKIPSYQVDNVPQNEKAVPYLSPQNNTSAKQDDNSNDFVTHEEIPAPVKEVPEIKTVPKFTSATSSSVLPPVNADHTTYTYQAFKAVDGDLTTCWCEGAEGQGEGEYITLYADSAQQFNQIVIYNGLCTSESLFNKNSRVKDCIISFSDGTAIQTTLNGDYSQQPCTVRLDNTISADSIEIKILSTYSGNKYSDTCISEIEVKNT